MLPAYDTVLSANELHPHHPQSGLTHDAHLEDVATGYSYLPGRAHTVVFKRIDDLGWNGTPRHIEPLYAILAFYCTLDHEDGF